MTRITEADLERLADRINTIAGTPKTPWQTVDGQTVGNVGNYHIDYAYGGAGLLQVQDESGACKRVIPGYTSKKELHSKMVTFIAGMTV